MSANFRPSPTLVNEIQMCRSTYAAEHERRLADVPDDYPVNIRSLIEEGLAVTATDYARCRHHHIALRHEMAAVFADVDALIAPAATGPAGDRSTTGDPAFNSPWSYTGLPTVSFPMGLSPDGLPLAVQIIGPPQGEADLFRVAAWCETVCAAAL